MIFRQVISEGLAHYSYYIGSGRAAAVIDPRRDSEIYQAIAERNRQKITHIFETHRNEDYLTGSGELAARCGALIYHGAAHPFTFGKSIKNGDSFVIGDIKIVVIDTPGHTAESISLAIYDPANSRTPCAVCTGDTVFAGDTGRTDLMGGVTYEEAAGLLHDSITKKILPLGDGVLLYPAHGAGSVCGGDISDRPVTTIGYEKLANPALSMKQKEFIGLKTSEHHYRPPYFRKMEELNSTGAPVLGHLPVLTPLSVPEVKEYQQKGALILDIRSPGSYGGGHIPGSLCIWRDGLSSFMGWFLDYSTPVIIIDDFNTGLETVVRHYIRLGYDTVRGFLAGGFGAWAKAGEPVSVLPSWSVQQFHAALREPESEMYILDVRDIRNRVHLGHINGDHHIYVGEIPARRKEILKSAHIVTYCDAGYKGCLAASYLLMHDYSRVTNILGGMTGWLAAGYDVEK